MIFSEIESSLKIAKSIYKIFSFANPEGRELEIYFPEKYIELTMLLKIPDGLRRKISRNMPIDIPGIKRIQIRALPSLHLQRNAIVQRGQQYFLRKEGLGDSNEFMLKVRYEAPKGALDELVFTKSAKEPIPKGKNVEYYISAELKKRKLLEKYYSEITIRDVDIGVRVAINQIVKYSVPREFIRRIKTIQKWIEERDREKILKLTRERLRQVRMKKFEDERKLIGKIRSYCEPSHFKDFVLLNPPFFYRTAVMGSDMFGLLPFPSVPKSMNVVAETTLSYDNPASSGYLIFKRQNFEKKLKSIFEKEHKRNQLIKR
jgi:hypothetical protein